MRITAQAVLGSGAMAVSEFNQGIGYRVELDNRYGSLAIESPKVDSAHLEPNASQNSPIWLVWRQNRGIQLTRTGQAFLRR
jgi:hypothetical protein